MTKEGRVKNHQNYSYKAKQLPNGSWDAEIMAPNG